MADTALSALTAATALDSDDLVYVVEDGASRKATTTQVATCIEALTGTLTNKTVVASSNTITDTSAAAGDLFKHNGTKFLRMARGSALQVLRVNSGGTDLEWSAPPSTTPGGSTGQLQYNNAGAFGGLTNVLGGSGYLSIGATVAAAGALRLANTGAITARNAANSGDVTIITVDASDQVVISNAHAIKLVSDTNGKSYTLLKHDSVQTTNNTQTTCGTVTIPTDSCCTVVATFRAIRSDGSASADYTRRCRAKNDGGTVTIGSVFDSWTDEEAAFAANDVTLDVSGTSVRGRVTGTTAITMRWSVTISVEVGAY